MFKPLSTLLASCIAICNLANAQSAPISTQNIVKSGSYQVELRIPEQGLFAGEATDVEFRISDLTQDDPIEGKRGVPNAQPQAAVTMPAMPGMPVMKPKIHSEGVPGDYGVELFFPHGGEYRLTLKAFPDGKPIQVSFAVNVRDAEAKKAVHVRPPYSVELLGFPRPARAGKPIDLKIAIRETLTGRRVVKFDEAHTKLIHLIVVSKDLGWFAHEHPVPQPDGSFRLSQTFPAGGDYILFADVAPKDKGSQVIAKPIHVTGAAGKWPKRLAPGSMTQTVGSMKAKLVPLELPIPVGKTTTLSFHLKDARTGKPIQDIQPYLGAHGHLMIIHQDGQVFVHSHPAEDATSEKLIQSGEIRFSARFPKPGVYKAWAQFQRGGKVFTFPYVFRVK